jgi:hypothetical protein
LERRGVRSAHVATASFGAIAHAVASAQGVKDHPIVVLPAGTNQMSSEELRPLAEHLLEVCFGLSAEP